MAREIPRKENPILLALQDGFIDVEVYLRKLATGEKDETSSIPMQPLDLVHLALRAVAYSQKSSYNLSKELDYYIGTRLSDKECKGLNKYRYVEYISDLKAAYYDVLHLLESKTAKEKDECIRIIKCSPEHFKTKKYEVESEYDPMEGYDEALDTLAESLASHMGYHPEEIRKDDRTKDGMKERIRSTISGMRYDTDWVDVSPEIIYYKGVFYWSGLNGIKDIARKMVSMDMLSGGFRSKAGKNGSQNGIPSKYICELIKGAGVKLETIRSNKSKIKKEAKEEAPKKKKEATPQDELPF